MSADEDATERGSNQMERVQSPLVEATSST
jgi:hypothetical protein